jgi:outer membrane protein insertion porin family
MSWTAVVRSGVGIAFLAFPAVAETVDLGVDPVGLFAFGVGYNLDAGATIVGRFRHDQFLGYDQAIDLGFSVSGNQQSYDLLLQNNRIGNGNPIFAFELGHQSADRQEFFGVDTSETYFRPRAVFATTDGTFSIEAIVGTDEITDSAAAPAVLQAEERGRDTYGLGLRYSGGSQSFAYGLSGAAMSATGDLTYAKVEANTTYKLATNRSGTDIQIGLAAGTIAVSKGQTSLNDRFAPSSGVIRGFAAGGFGPADPAVLDGGQVGGTHYAVMSFDARRTEVIPAMPELAIGFFIDLGSAWGLDDNGDATRAAIDDAANLRGSVGIGASRSFGPARIELILAHPFLHEDTDHLQQIQLNFKSEL